MFCCSEQLHILLISWTHTLSFRVMSCFKEFSLVKVLTSPKGLRLYPVSLVYKAGCRATTGPDPKSPALMLKTLKPSVRHQRNWDPQPSILREVWGRGGGCQRVEVQGLAIWSSRGLQVLQSFKWLILDHIAKPDLRPPGAMTHVLSATTSPHAQAMTQNRGPHRCTHTTLQSKVMQRWKLFLKSDWM